MRLRSLIVESVQTKINPAKLLTFLVAVFDGEAFMARQSESARFGLMYWFFKATIVRVRARTRV